MTLKADKQKIIELENRALELEEKWKRSLADYSNLEKRIDGQRQLFISLVTTGIVAKFIDVLDDLYLAQKHLNDPGLKLAIDKYVAVLKSEGLVEIDHSQKFDPTTMECIEAVEGEKDKVVEIKKRGYLLNGQCLRPAQVSVGRGAEIKN
ncbi:MAG: nucleotide exchange factor GrpE [Candidatus Shapirobacteria bacterium]